MKFLPLFSLLLTFAPLFAAGGESYFFIRSQDTKDVVKRVEGDVLHIMGGENYWAEMAYWFIILLFLVAWSLFLILRWRRVKFFQRS